MDQGKGHYRIITQLKRRFPGLKIILSVGGGADVDAEADTNKYLNLLETSGGRIAFINSAYSLIKTYDFDGIDLAWQFPPNKPKKIKGTFGMYGQEKLTSSNLKIIVSVGSLWSGFKKSIGITGNPIDEKADEHKEEFTAFIREIKNAFRHDNYLVSLTVLPNVNSTCNIESGQILYLA